jgi:hypothetical protein
LVVNYYVLWRKNLLFVKQYKTFPDTCGGFGVNRIKLMVEELNEIF